MDALTWGEVRTQLPRVGLSPPWVPRIASRHIIYKYFHPLSCLSGFIMPLTDLYSVLGGGGVMVGSKSKSPSLDINVQVASRLLVLRPAYTVVPFVPVCWSCARLQEDSLEHRRLFRAI